MKDSRVEVLTGSFELEDAPKPAECVDAVCSATVERMLDSFSGWGTIENVPQPGDPGGL